MHSSPVVTKVRYEDFERVRPLLLGFNSPRLTDHDWRQLFQNHWGTGEDYCGYALSDNDNLLGYLGIIFSQRVINGNTESFANLTSLILRPECRGRGFSSLLLDEPLKLQGYTITAFTPAKSIYQMYVRRGFDVLDDKVVIAFPSPAIFSSLRDRCCIELHTDRIMASLPAPDRQLMSDHLQFPCSFALLRSSQGNCFIVFNRIILRHLPLVSVIYLSNPRVFVNHINILNMRLCFSVKVAGLILSSRYLQGHSLSNSLTRERLQFYKSPSLTANAIDMLYSEIPILNLSI